MDYTNPVLTKQLLCAAYKRIQELEDIIKNLLNKGNNDDKKLSFIFTFGDADLPMFAYFQVVYKGFTYDNTPAPLEILEKDFYGKRGGNIGDSSLMYVTQLHDSYPQYKRVGLYKHYPFDSNKPPEWLGTIDAIFPHVKHEDIVISANYDVADLPGSDQFNVPFFKTAEFDLIVDGKPVVVTDEVVQNVFHIDVIPCVFKYGLKLSTQIAGCDFALGISQPKPGLTLNDDKITVNTVEILIMGPALKFSDDYVYTWGINKNNVDKLFVLKQNHENNTVYWEDVATGDDTDLGSELSIGGKQININSTDIHEINPIAYGDIIEVYGKGYQTLDLEIGGITVAREL